MSIKRIWRVYFDLPDYIVPKEVSKVFRLMKKRQKLMERIETAWKKEKAKLEVELAEVNSDIDLTMNVVSPKGANWKIRSHNAGNGAFFVIEITEPVQESIFDKGQDDD